MPFNYKKKESYKTLIIFLFNLFILLFTVLTLKCVLKLISTIEQFCLFISNICSISLFNISFSFRYSYSSFVKSKSNLSIISLLYKFSTILTFFYILYFYFFSSFPFRCCSRHNLFPHYCNYLQCKHLRFHFHFLHWLFQ